MRRVAAAALAATCAVVALCAPGCADDDGADGDEAGSAPSDTSSGLHAVLERSTLFETVRALAVHVSYDGDHDVQLGAVQLSSALFEPVPPQPRDPVVPAGGGRVTMPLRFGAARCDEEADGPPRLLTDVDGEDVAVAIDEQPPSLLADLHARECAVAAVRAGVELRFGDNWVRTAPRQAEGGVEVIQSHPGVIAALDELQGNVIFTVEAVAVDGGDQEPLAEVSDDQPSGMVPVTISAARCDPHALIEYKRTFIFVAWVAVGGEEPVGVDIEAEGEARRVLEQVRLACLQ